MIERRIAVRGIIYKDHELLCMRLKPYEGKATNLDQDYWCTPGGGLDTGEPLKLALEREIFEETGVKPVIGNLLYVQQFSHANREHMEFFFHITNPADFDTIDLESSTHGSTEVAEVAFINPSKYVVLPKFLTEADISSDIKSRAVRIYDYLS